MTEIAVVLSIIALLTGASVQTCKEPKIKTVQIKYEIGEPLTITKEKAIED
jgi:hypothetical protein